jgi:hypothetical protein
MKKREKIESSRMVLTYALNLTEIRPNSELRQYPEEQGFRYIRITITDVKTGYPMRIHTPIHDSGLPPATAIYTFARDKDIHQLANDLLELAKWPNELLNYFYPAVIADSNQWIDGKNTARQILDRQLLGGKRTKHRWEDYYHRWQEDGFSKAKKRELKEEYLSQCPDTDYNAAERFDRTMRRYRQKADKR